MSVNIEPASTMRSDPFSFGLATGAVVWNPFSFGLATEAVVWNPFSFGLATVEAGAKSAY